MLPTVCIFIVNKINYWLTLFTGHAEILGDIHSQAENLSTFTGGRESGEDIIQPKGGFSSPSGIYVRVKKPLEKGHIQFVYGVYKLVNNATKSKYFHHDSMNL